MTNAMAVERSSEGAAGAPLRVLLIEDSADDAELELRELRRAGFSVSARRVQSPADLLEALKGGPWDLVLCDHAVPLFGGMEALQLAKQSGLDVPFIVVSGMIGEEFAVGCMKAGAHDYIMKSSLPRLVPAVERELRDAEERRARRRAEESVRGSEARFRAMIENASDLTALVGPGWRFLYQSPSVERVLGYRPEELAGRSVLELVHRDDVARAEQSLAASSSEGAAGEPFEVRWSHRDGSYRDLETIAQACREDPDEAIAVLNSRDVSERNRGRRELSERVEELARSNRDLEQFAYVVSHDLQEPLRMVASFTQLLAKRCAGRLDSEAEQFMRFAIDGATRMRKMITDLLSCSRVNSEGVAFLETSCQAALEQALSNLAARIAASEALVTSEGLPSVMADECQLVQLFQNLIDNAIKFRSEEAPRIHVSAVRGSEEWVLRVTDNGIGIDEKHFERVFMMFRRLHPHERYPGTGIGLAVCRRIVERHGGRILVRSDPGSGSTFEFTLPAGPRQQES